MRKREREKEREREREGERGGEIVSYVDFSWEASPSKWELGAQTNHRSLDSNMDWKTDQWDKQPVGKTCKVSRQPKGYKKWRRLVIQTQYFSSASTCRAVSRVTAHYPFNLGSYFSSRLWLGCRMSLGKVFCHRIDVVPLAVCPKHLSIDNLRAILGLFALLTSVANSEACRR